MTKAFLFGLTILGSAVGYSSNAQERPVKVGSFTEVFAWVNALPGPGSNKSLNVKGRVGAGTICHKASTKYVGDDKSNPPIYTIEVTTYLIPGTNCIQRTGWVDFEFTQPNYTWVYAEVKVMTDIDSMTVKIDTAH